MPSAQTQNRVFFRPASTATPTALPALTALQLQAIPVIRQMLTGPEC